jgi:peptidoglycan/xylan/chitin deacetylase (PgdA/CDA1 family)
LTTVAYLMYHQIGDPRPSEARYAVSVPAFRAQMAHLAQAGHEVLSVGEALARPETEAARVVLTFDDGSATDLLVAAPLLSAHRFGATFYVVPGLLGTPGFLSAEQLAALADQGFEIGSHSMTHRYLSDLGARELWWEVYESKRALEQTLGATVHHFACPGGRVNGDVVRAVQDAGYRTLATSHVGTNTASTDPYRLTRIAVHRRTELPEFARLCRGQGLRRRILQERVLGAAKHALGNRAYDRVRRLLLRSQRMPPASPPSSDSMTTGCRTS